MSNSNDVQSDAKKENVCDLSCFFFFFFFFFSLLLLNSHDACVIVEVRINFEYFKYSNLYLIDLFPSNFGIKRKSIGMCLNSIRFLMCVLILMFLVCSENIF